VNHVGIIEAAHDVQDGVGVADVPQELVAQPFPLAGAFDQPGDIYEFDRGVDGDPHIHQFSQRFHPIVRDGHDGPVGLDGAEGVVGDFSFLGAGQRVEHGAFAHVGQTDDADAQAHRDPLYAAFRTVAPVKYWDASTASRRPDRTCPEGIGLPHTRCRH